MCYADLGYKTISTNPCGEIPLCPYDSCRLLAINLYSYVDHPFTPAAEFNFEEFKTHVQMAQRMMDDIIDLEIEKVEQIIEKIKLDPEVDTIKNTELTLWHKILKTCVEGRRTGVGITGEGDMLAALGLQYGSDEAIAFSVKVHQTLALSAYRQSVTLAQERGAFPIYNTQRESNNPFINRIKEADPGLYEDMAKYGRRNIALLTIAPTGTTSLMTQTSSGIEPVFMVSYKRRRKVNPNDQEVNATFIDEVGDHWEEYNVLHPQFYKWLEVNGYDVESVATMPTDELNELIQKSPYHKSTANDIDWVQKVKMQGAIQKWVDHSISVTVNVPNETTVEMVNEIYRTAWEVGCKGCTIYRDGSRSGVLVSNEESKEVSEDRPVTLGESTAPVRPEKLEAELIRIKNNDENWLAVVGLLQGRPYEIFTGRAEDTFKLPEYVDKGWVIKNYDDEKEQSRYDFQFLDRDWVSNNDRGTFSFFQQRILELCKINQWGSTTWNAFELRG